MKDKEQEAIDEWLEEMEDEPNQEEDVRLNE